MTQKKKIIIISSIAVFIVIVAIISLLKGFSDNKIVQISGILEADNTEVPSLTSGVIKEIKVKEGNEVKKGDVLIILDSGELEIRREQAESVVKQTEAQLEMIESGATESEIKQLKAKVNQAQANLQNIQSGARPEEIAQAQAKLESAEASFNKAKSEFESAQKLYEQDIISKSKLEESQLAYNSAKSVYTGAQESLKLLRKGPSTGQVNIAQQQLAASKAALSNIMEGANPAQIKAAQAQIEQSKAELKLIDQMIEDSQIKSPIKGTINQLSVSTGELITKGSSVASILDLENLWVKIYVPESKLVYMNLGQPAKIYPEAIDSLEFPGKVTYISQKGAFIPPGTKESVDQQVFEVRVTLDKSRINNIQLRPGMSVKVKVDVSGNKHQLKKSNTTKG